MSVGLKNVCLTWRLPGASRNTARPALPGNPRTLACSAVTFPERCRRSVASVGEAQPAGARPGWATPATAWALVGVTVLLAAALIPLSLGARQNPLATGSAQIAVAVSLAAVGVVVARHRPRNPIGCRTWHHDLSATAWPPARWGGFRLRWAARWPVLALDGC